MYKPDVCIYHANCHDGFTAAWVVNQHFSDVEFIPAQYGDSIDPIIEKCAGKHVLMVDFSFKKEDLIYLKGHTKSIIILDHHKTAKDNLKDFLQVQDLIAFAYASQGDNFRGNKGPYVYFNMNFSGAYLAQMFCFPDDEVPELVKFVQDRDLWQFKFEETKAVSIFLSSLDQNFSNWDYVNNWLKREPESFLIAAKQILRFYEKKVEQVASLSVMGEFDGFTDVPIVSCPPFMVSDVCNFLLDFYDYAPFAVAKVESKGKISYSLRSRDDRVDVSEIAAKYGGGGHRNAARMRMP